MSVLDAGRSSGWILGGAIVLMTQHSTAVGNAGHTFDDFAVVRYSDDQDASSNNNLSKLLPPPRKNSWGFVGRMPGFSGRDGEGLRRCWGCQFGVFSLNRCGCVPVLLQAGTAKAEFW